MKTRAWKILTTMNLLALAMFGLTQSAGAQLNYVISGSTASVTAFPGTSGNIVIAPTYDGYPVTSIGQYAFWDCPNLTGVTIPNSVTSIGDWAFENCSNLTSVTIPNSVTSIGQDMFFDCSGLTSVTIPNSITNIVLELFYDCSGLTSVTIPNSVTSISRAAFENCSRLTSVTIPNSVTSIGTYAFNDCSSLTSVMIPNSVTSIGPSAFGYCGLTSVTIPNSITNIDLDLFEGCSNLKSVTIPTSVTSIGDYAFAYSGLTSVTFPASVTSIGTYAFAYSGLTSVTIPASLTSIGYLAFEYCSALTNVCFEGNAPNSLDYIFGYDPALSVIYYISGTTGWTSEFNNIPTAPCATCGGSSFVIPQPNKALGCHCSDPDPGVGDPIRIGVGNLYEEVKDYSTADANPLSFTRYYNSQGDSNSVAVTLGRNWRSTYDRYLRITGGSIIVERADGQELTFTNIGGSWASDSDVDLQLLASGSSWTLICSDDSIETYNSAGWLTSIQQRDGYAQTLQYGAGNELASVTDSFGRMLQFTYQSNLLHTVTAPNGLVLTYGYTSSGVTPGVLDRLASVTYSTSPQTSQSYLYENSSLPFALTGIIDEDGNRFGTWTYDSEGRATSSQLANGADLTLIGYNADGSRSVTNALGSVMVYKFTTLQGVPKATEIDRLATASVPAATMTYSYDTNGYIAEISDWNTNFTIQVNDIHDQPLVVNEAVGTAQARTTTANYITNFYLPTQIVAPRKTTTFVYDSNGNLLSRTETDTSTGTVPYSTSGQTRTWTNTYDALGHMLTATGPRTDVVATTTFTYDASNNLSTITDPLGHVTVLTNYTGSGLPLKMIDPNGVVTTFAYDVRDRLLSRTVHAADGDATTSFAYDPAGQITRITLPDGSYLNYQRDAAHRLQSVSNSLGESISYGLDASGDITNQTIKDGSGVLVKTQSAVFDQLGRMLQQIGASSQTTTYGYDSLGNRVSIKDGLNNSTTRAFDALNRLTTTIDPLYNTTHYAYDAQDNLISVTDPRSLVTSYVYDGFGRVIQKSSPDSGTTVYVLDNAGNRTSETDARGVVRLRTFDKLNRVTTETFPASPGENITYTYDATNGGNFGIGRLTGYSDETGSTTLKYNERGDVVSTTRTIGGTAYTTQYGYDLADRITSITYPSGHVVTYTRDTQGRISSVVYQPSVAGTITILATNVTYMPFGPLSGLVYGNGLRRTQTYDQDYRLTGITTYAAGANIQNLSYTYNAVNDITAINDHLASAYNQTFAYDPDYRLTQAVGNYGTTAYSYDADGNRLTRTAGNITETYNYSSTANLLQSTVKAGDTRNFGYTADGNVTSDDRGTTTNLVFGYDNRNRYSSLSYGSTTATYEYNALGERLIKTVNGVTTHFHYDQQGHLLAESQSDGAMIREYVWLDDMPLAQIESDGTIYYIHPDHLNTPQKMTDANQAIVWENEQQPFGEAALPVLNSVGFNAGEQFQMTVNGGPNDAYVVQTTTNLSSANWVSLGASVAPFTFTDSSAQNVHARFYRVLYAPNVHLASVTNNLRFPGQYYDVESGLTYNMMRDYDPSLGRYIQSDPIGLEGGINSFSYAESNPINGVDLLGQCSRLHFALGFAIFLSLAHPIHFFNDPGSSPLGAYTEQMKKNDQALW
jgi:RHS repeat-associated protein